MMKVLILTAVLGISMGKLYQMAILFRHGARYHVSETYDGEETKPLWGELTAVGQRQHQSLGKYLREEYVEGQQFLSSKYSRKELQAYATTYHRTMQSFESMMNGLYPPGTGLPMELVHKVYHLPPYTNQTDDEEQNFALPHGQAPIPVKQSQKVILQPEYCPNFLSMVQKNLDLHVAEVTEMQNTYSPFLKSMSAMFSTPNLEINNVSNLYDAVSVDQYLNRPLPSDFTSDHSDNLRHLTGWVYNTRLSGDVSKLINSEKIQKILTHFDNRMRMIDTYFPKATFFSAHDIDEIPMMMALNLTSPDCIEEKWRKGSTSALSCEDQPLFASSLIFQLHSDDNGRTFYVQVKYNGKYAYLCEKKDTKCPYTDWKNRMKQNISTNLESLCGKKIAHPFSPKKNHRPQSIWKILEA